MRRPITLLAALIVASLTAHANVTAITRTGDVLDVDSTTGASHSLFATHLTVNSLAETGGTYHTVSNGHFYRISLNAETATQGAAISVPGDVRGLAIDANGTFWAVIDDNGTDRLWRLNLNTGAGTLIGDTGFTKVQSLDCDSQGRLFAYDLDHGLLRVSRADGHAWDLDPNTPGGDNIQSISFDDNDVLFGASDKLYRIKPSSGALTLVGGSLGDVRGLEFETRPVTYALPSSAVVKLGKASNQGVGLLQEDEGDGLTVCKFVVPNSTTQPIQVEVIGASPFSQLDAMTVRLRQRMNSGGLYKSFVDVFDYTADKFKNVADLAVGASYRTDDVVVPGFLDDYVSGSGEMRVRYRVRATGPTAVQLFCHEMDQVTWYLKPTIR